ncbi:hypothetical protein ACFE04_030973 [Oxalis oulophora]
MASSSRSRPPPIRYRYASISIKLEEGMTVTFYARQILEFRRTVTQLKYYVSESTELNRLGARSSENLHLVAIIVKHFLIKVGAIGDLFNIDLVEIPGFEDQENHSKYLKQFGVTKWFKDITITESYGGLREMCRVKEDEDRSFVFGLNYLSRSIDRIVNLISQLRAKQLKPHQNMDHSVLSGICASTVVIIIMTNTRRY